MAAVTVSGTYQVIARGVIRTIWSFPVSVSAGAGSIGTPLGAPNYPDKSVEWRGPWVTGVTIVIEGSNTATYTTGTAAWMTLNDPGSTALSYSTGKIKAILENPRWIRPRISARTGTLGTPTIEIVAQTPGR